MAYNAATRLLLRFSESDGSVATVDSSQAPFDLTVNGNAEVSSAEVVFSTNSLLVGEPYGDEGNGSVTVDSPGGVFSSSTTEARCFDFWFMQEASPAAYYGTIFKVTWDDGTSLDVITGPTGALYVESGPSPELPAGGGLYSANFSPAYGTWQHARLYIENNYWVLGLNGSQVDSATGTLSFWPGTGSNTVTEFVVGDYGAAYSGLPFRGYIDAFQVTEGDTSWTGGNYTVPTTEPDAYGGGGGPAELFADGANTLDDVASEGTATGQGELLAEGANTLDDISSAATAEHQEPLLAQGSNTLDAIGSTATGLVYDVLAAENDITLDSVTSTGTMYGPDWFTTLMLHFNLGTQLKDWSPHNNVVNLGGDGGVFGDAAVTKLGNGAWAASGPVGTPGLCLNVPVQSGLFWDVTSDKIIDCFFRPVSPNGYADTIFSVAFEGTTLGTPNGVTLYMTSTWPYALGIEVITPNLFLATEIANGAATNQYRHVRLAILGNQIVVCLDGVVVHTQTAPGPIWPQSNAQTGFSIGNRWPAVADLGFNGAIDEFRIQEGSFSNHGYAGGNFTPNLYEWYPAMLFAAGANTVSVASQGTAQIQPTLYATGENTIYDFTSYGAATVLLRAQGANTLDDVTQIFGYFQPEMFAAGANTVQAVTGLGELALSWQARGTALVSVTSVATADDSIPVLSLVGGNTVSVSSRGTATSAQQAVGSNTVSVSSAGTLAAFTAAAGSNTVSVISQGTAVRERYAQGANTVGVTSVGSATVTLFARGASLADVFSYGTAKALITCSGANTVDDVCGPRYESTYESAAAYIRTRRSVVCIRTRQQSISVVT